MRTNLLGAALLSLALPLVPLAAQDHAPRARLALGLVLDGQGDRGADSAGARVRSVMPGSPGGRPPASSGVTSSPA